MAAPYERLPALAVGCFGSIPQDRILWLPWLCRPCLRAATSLVGRGSCRAEAPFLITAPQERRPARIGVVAGAIGAGTGTAV